MSRNRYTEGLTPPKSPERRLKIQYRHENQKLKSQILALHSYMQRREKEHEFEVSQLKKQNKHFAHQIMRLQEELVSSKQNKRRGDKDEDLFLDLQAHIHQVQKEIRKRQEREIVLLQDNEELRITVQHLRAEVQRLSNQRQALIRQLRDSESQGRNREGDNKKIEQLEMLMEELVDTKNQIEQEVLALKTEAARLKAENEELRKDSECLLQLIDSS